MARVLLTLCLILTAWPCAAAPADDLLALVPPDPGFVAVVRDPRGHWQRFAASPFARQAQASPLGQFLLLAAQPKWDDLNGHFRAYYQTTLGELRDEVFGDAQVFAYWPAGKGGDRALFLNRARKPELLDRLVLRFNDAEIKAGHLARVEVRTHQGKAYQRREGKDGDVTFLAVADGLLAFSQDEELLRQVLDRLAPRHEPAPLARSLQSLGLADALAVWWINPRAFDEPILAKVRGAPPQEAALHQLFWAQWQKTTDIAVALRLAEGLELQLAVRTPAGGVAGPAGGGGDLWSKVPERTFITVTGQIDLTQVPALVPTEAQAKLEATLELAGRALFGRDFKTEVLPALGPDWGAYVAAPPDGEPGWFPDVVLALRVRNAAGGDRPLDRALLDALRAVAGLAILEPVQKGQAVRMQTGLQDGEPLFWLSNDREWPAGCRPTGAVKAGYLLLASSPGAVRRFGARPGPAAGAPPVARVSFAEVAAYLRHQERRGALVAALAEANHQPAPAINGQLDQLLAVLDFLKEAELAFQATPAQLNLRLRLQPAQPLR